DPSSEQRPAPGPALGGQSPWCHGRLGPGPPSDDACGPRFPASSVEHLRRATTMSFHFGSWLRRLQARLSGDRRRPAGRPPAQPRAQLWLERLESRTVPAIMITRTSAPIFYVNFDLESPNKGPNLTSHYVAYQITNPVADGVNYADLWASIGD